MKIDICIQTHNFNKRLCWMLSSILQQKERKEGIGLPELRVCVSFVSDKVTNAGMHKLLDVFSQAGLNICRREYGGFEFFKLRGNVRNRDLENANGTKATDADWILWADSDMVYHPQFFGTLGHLLRTSFRGNMHCLHSKRKSTILEETETLIGQYQYPCIIPDAYETADKLQAIEKANIGAGYCQIANVDNLFTNHNGLYVERAVDNDWDTKGQKARSDQVFRRRLGREKIPLPIQIHLQHTRENPYERQC